MEICTAGAGVFRARLLEPRRSCATNETQTATRILRLARLFQDVQTLGCGDAHMRVGNYWHKATAFGVLILSIAFFLPLMASPRRGGQPRKSRSQQSTATVDTGAAQT